MEVWKDVVGFEGLYKVSNLGRVKSLPKFYGRSFRQERIMATVRDKAGYCVVNLRKDGGKRLTKVHRLVAQTFIGNPRNLPQVNHIDGDKGNNAVSNLEWCTAKDNIRHAWDTGLHPRYCGEKAPMYGKKLSVEARRKISENSLAMWKKRKAGELG